MVFNGVICAVFCHCQGQFLSFMAVFQLCKSSFDDCLIFVIRVESEHLVKMINCFIFFRRQQKVCCSNIEVSIYIRRVKGECLMVFINGLLYFP